MYVVLTTYDVPKIPMLATLSIPNVIVNSDFSCHSCRDVVGSERIFQRGTGRSLRLPGRSLRNPWASLRRAWADRRRLWRPCFCHQVCHVHQMIRLVISRQLRQSAFGIKTLSVQSFVRRFSFPQSPILLPCV